MRQSVLNREQQKVLELLKEIDIICRKNKITYFLSPYLTLCAVTERPFPLNPEAGVIYMKTGDMERFKNVFEEEPVLRRALESMDSYKYFPGFYLRYTDKDTLFYKMDDYGKFQYPVIILTADKFCTELDLIIVVKNLIQHVKALLCQQSFQ